MTPTIRTFSWCSHQADCAAALRRHLSTLAFQLPTFRDRLPRLLDPRPPRQPRRPDDRAKGGVTFGRQRFATRAADDASSSARCSTSPASLPLHGRSQPRPRREDRLAWPSPSRSSTTSASPACRPSAPPCSQVCAESDQRHRYRPLLSGLLRRQLRRSTRSPAYLRTCPTTNFCSLTPSSPTDRRSTLCCSSLW